METHFTLPQFAGVEMGTVKWPMSVIRLRSEDRKALSAAASYIHSQWRTYSDLRWAFMPKLTARRTIPSPPLCAKKVRHTSATWCSGTI